MRLAGKVLLVGWDGADWKIIRSLVDAGRMPRLAKLIHAGASGNLASLRPTLSPMLWTSLATGKRPHKHGIHGFREPRSAGNGLGGDGIRAVASTSRTTKAVWNILTQSGLRSHCVNGYASHPAEPISGVCVSDRFAVTPPGPGQPWPLEDDVVHPLEVRDTLADLRLRPEEIDGDALLPFMPGAARIDQARDKRLLACATLLARTATTHGAITWCIEHRPWDFAAVFYNGIGQFSHLFMDYNPPARHGVSAQDFDLYQGVVRAAYQFHDMMLGRLLDLAGEDVTVLVISDHAYRPPAAGAGGGELDLTARTLETLSLEHRPQGFCVMRGPQVRPGSTLEGASLLDVTPTILTLFGLPVGADMDGRPWVEAMDGLGDSAAGGGAPGTSGPTPIPDSVPSWDRVPGDAGLHGKLGDEQHEKEAGQGASSAESIEAVQHLIDLGYVDPPDEEAREAIDRTLAENRFNLARSLLDARQPEPAIALLTDLARKRPGHAGYNAALFQALFAAGRTVEARRLAEAMWARGHRGPLAHLALAAVDMAERNAAAALQHLEEAERATPDLPGLSALIGQAWLRLREWDRAARAFQTAQKSDSEDESAWHGLACAALGNGDDEGAAEYAKRAVGLRSDYPEACYHLGVALSRLGRGPAAEAALRRCLSLRPGLLAAYGRLLDLYEPGGAMPNPARARECRQRANDIILQRRLRHRLVEQNPSPPAGGPAASGPSSGSAGHPPDG